MYSIYTLVLVMIGCFFNLQLQAQSSINSGGTVSASNPNGSITSSIGQVFDNAYQGTTISLIAGVQQPLEIDNALPVTLVYFRAVATPEQQVQITWQVASEFNNDFFSIERSTNSKNFSILKTRPSVGDTKETHTYSELDAQPLAGTSYYRLKQTDKDGTFTYSQLASVHINKPNETVSTYPNPTSEQLIIQLSYTPSQMTHFELINQQGIAVQQGKLTSNNTSLTIAHLPAGLYVLQVKDATHGTQQFKVVKM